MNLWQKLFSKPGDAPAPPPPRRPDNRERMRALIDAVRANAKPERTYNYPIQPPVLPSNVVPKWHNGGKAAVAMDGASYDYARSFYEQGIGGGQYVGFPGYPYLAQLSTRAEYRMFATAIANSLTREWITLSATDSAGPETADRIAELNKAVTDIGLRDTIHLAASHESFYGRAQIYLDVQGHDPTMPLLVSNKTIKKGTRIKIKAVEAMWTTPKTYNAINPMRPDFYVPSAWFVLGKEIHASRLMMIITRPVLDMLKPAFNFGGMSMSQLAEPYVDNWLRTRQSVSDLISNFSITALATATDQMLQGDAVSAENVFNRAELFTLTRSNRGLMLLDKEREELVQLNTPLSGLHELQAQSQEQMCSVSHTPGVILLGIAPTGFGNVAEGEIRSYYDHVAGEQEAYWRTPIETVLDLLQLSLFGEIDENIVMNFQPLYQMTSKELAEIRTADGTTDCNYIDRGVLAPEEVREKLARNPESGYEGIDVEDLPEIESEGQEEENEDVA